MNRRRLKKLEDRIGEALEARLHTVAVVMVSALRDDKFSAELPEKENMAKEGAEA